jgi:hypothetical protein
MSHCRCITRWSIVAVALTLPFAQPAAAQARDSLSLDATIGASTGLGGRRPYYNSGDIAAEMTLAFRFHPERSVAAVGALSVGGRGTVLSDDVCRLVDGPGGAVSCAPRFPALNHVGILGGVESRASRVSMRVLAGPAFYGREGASGFGAQTQLDGAIGFSHLALVGAVRGSWIARVTGETFLFRSLEFGLRVQ